MKRIIIILILIAMTQLCLATEKVKLPEEPWKYIVEMMKYSQNNRWEDDISIKLWGNYTEIDSLMIENSIKTLNDLTSTVKLKLSKSNLGKMELFFLDSTNEEQYNHLFPYQKPKTYHSVWNHKNSTEEYSEGLMLNYKTALFINSIQDSVRQNYLTSKIAYALFPNHFDNIKYFVDIDTYNGPISIYSSRPPFEIEPDFLELSEFDKRIIKTVYSSNFTELLPLAKKQFGKIINPEWVRNHSYEILVFPFVLAVFLLVGLFILLYRKLFSRIRDKWAQFNAILALALPLLGVLIATYFMTALSLKYPLAPNYNQSNLLAGIVITCMLGLPALNLIRLIEVAINRRTKHKYIKTLLLFLSTSLIPSGTLLPIAYFSFKEDIDEEGIRAMIVIFLVFTIIGIIRALISFFVLKEKEIKIENEVKLANLRELKTKAELNALHSKINPHFLYNSLNSIAGLAKTNAEKTEHMALSLSKLFRYSINKEQSDWSTLAEELEMVKVYLDIEKVRFDDRLDYYIDLPKELEMVQIPQFLIQPLAENALKHGISKLVDNGIVKISVREIDTWLEINVADNGPDFPNELNPGFGLQSIYDKLEILFPDKFEMHFLNSPNKHIQIKLALK